MKYTLPQIFLSANSSLFRLQNYQDPSVFVFSSPVAGHYCRKVGTVTDINIMIMAYLRHFLYPSLMKESDASIHNG